MTDAEQVEPVARDAARLLREILATLERGELTAPAPMVSHLAGALAAVLRDAQAGLVKHARATTSR